MFLQVVADLLSAVLDERNTPSFAATSQVMTENEITYMYINIRHACSL